MEYLEQCLNEEDRTYNSPQLAAKLAAERGVELTPDWIRQLLKKRLSLEADASVVLFRKGCRSYALYKIDGMWIAESKGFQRHHKNRHYKPCNVTIHMRFG